MGLFSNKFSLKNFGKYGILGAWSGNSKNKKSNNIIYPQEFTGQRPLSGQEYRDLPTSKNYEPQIIERSKGEGLVGFAPNHRDKLRNEFLQDFGDYSADIYSKAAGQASGQGLRGGIPIENQNMLTRSLSRARESGLADIDIEDLEARREDINRATYAQPEYSNYVANAQAQRAGFDLNEYNATQPTYIDQPPSQVLPALIGAAGTIGGAYFGGPAGAAAGGAIGNSLGRAYGNRSLSNIDPYDLNNMYAQFRASQRRY